MIAMDTNPPTGAGIGIKKFIPGIAWFFLVLVLICLPGSDLPTVDDWLGKIYFDKWIHVGLFAVLAFLFMHPFLRSSLTLKKKWDIAIRIALSTAVWGLATEFIQKFFVTGRSFDLFDWAADTLGALAALLFANRRFLSR
jgi:VanZ family protein